VNGTTFTIDYSQPSQYKAFFRHLSNAGTHTIDGIIHCASANYTWRDPHLTATVMEAQQVYGSISLLHLYHHLPSPKAGARPALVVVTNGVQSIHGHDTPQPMHSVLWGMARVMANEAAHYSLRCFDLSANPSRDEFGVVVQALQRPHPKENEMAIRSADVFVPRLQVPGDAGRLQVLPKVFSGWRTYVVTGFGGMAFSFVEWMVQKGAHHFALISRTGRCPSALEAKIESLRAQGCSFEFFSADVSDYAALEKVFISVEQLMPKVGGVVHAAGLIKANTLADLNDVELLQILRPKMCGAWNLHLLTQHKELDCFIMFSSVASLIGLSGQASYVGANTFLDTLAHTRKAMGLPALTVNWGVIADAGMVARDGALARYAAAEGLISVPMTAAMEIFDTVGNHGYAQIAIAKLHLPTLTSYYTALAQRNYLRALAVKVQAPHTPGSFRERFNSLMLPAEKTAALEALVVQQVAQIIKTAASRINTSMTFKSLGIDSIMAIQLRNGLEEALDLKLAVSMLWTHPSIAAFAANLGEILTAQPAAALHDLHEGEHTSDWFVIPRPNAAASFRVFCFHDAGGDSTLYRGWETLLGNTVECIAVELPGRGKRVSDKKYISLEAMLQALKPAMVPLLDKPYVCFGHSMGGLLAFEIIRALRHDGLPLPLHLFVSSVPALNTYTPDDTDHASISRNLFRNKTMDSDLIQSLLKLLKDDLTLLSRYHYSSASPLNVQVVALYAGDDPRVQKHQVERWQQETTQPLKTVCRTGGHRYIEHDSRYLTDLIRQTLAVTRQ
jgi:surfactin synthase thioesterase subunit/short-subunit dehydrogenase/acyl carrier protein